MRRFQTLTMLFALSFLSGAPQLLAKTRGNEIPTFSGDAYQRGLQQGRLFKNEILELQKVVLDTYLGSWPRRIWAIQQSKNMESYIPRDLVDELKGIASATETDFRDILLANLLPDLDQLAGMKSACSTFLVMPYRSVTGSMLYGRNLDWYHDIAALMRKAFRPVIFDEPGKQKILSITLPGMVGVLTGINKSGVMASLMYSSHEDQTSYGMPLTFLYRQVLADAKNYDDAKDMFKKAKPRTIAINTMLADGKDAAILETSSTKYAKRLANEKGLLYSANHFESKEFIGNNPPDRDYRWPVLSGWDQRSGKMSRGDVQNIIRDAAMDDDSFENVLAVIQDFGANKLYWGTGTPAAGGVLQMIDLKVLQ